MNTVIKLASALLLIAGANIALAQQMQFCIVFPNGNTGNCYPTLQNCETLNSNKHVGARCVAVQKK